MKQKVGQTIYDIGLLSLLAVIFIRGHGLWPGFEIAVRDIPSDHWAGFIISLLGYGTVAVVAGLVARAIGRFSFLFYFNILLFGLFFLEQIYIMLKIWRWVPESVFLWFVLVAITVWALIENMKKPKSVRSSARRGFDPAVVIIFGWIVIALMYYLPTNLSLTRTPYTDEGVLWYVQAADFINIPAAAREYTRCLSSQSYGIPFICALPNLLFAFKLNHNIFYMPIILIFQTGLFLNYLRKDKWAFVFFSGALLMTVMRHLWWRQLFLGLVYGEGIAAVFFMVIVYECWRLKEQARTIPLSTMGLLSFGIGLLAFTKAPTSLIFCAFFPFLVFQQVNPVHRVFLFLFMLCLPFLSWVLFSPDPTHYLGQISALDADRFGLMVAYLVKWYTSPIFFAGLSFIGIIFSFKKDEWLHLVPVLSQFLFIVWGYLFVFSQREYESAGRYIMHGMLALYFLGSVAFSRIVQRFMKRFDVSGLR